MERICHDYSYHLGRDCPKEKIKSMSELLTKEELHLITGSIQNHAWFLEHLYAEDAVHSDAVAMRRKATQLRSLIPKLSKLTQEG